MVGELWYAHKSISHPGNPCTGGNDDEIDILPPPGTAFAMDANHPVSCAVNSPGAQQTTVYYRQDQGCPQAPSQGVEGYTFWLYNGAQAQL